MVIRKIIYSVVRFLFKMLSRLTAVGLENIPSQGGCILASNHLSRLDSALIFSLLEREDMTALVTDKYQKNPLFRWLINSVHGIWINRESADFRALREARDFLKQGGGIGIAPEGTRSQTGGLIKAKTGVAYLAEKTGVPIVPVAISGTEKALPQLLRFRRPAIYVRFGEPFKLPPLGRDDRTASLQKNTDEIMCRIAAMLSPEYHGVYSGHPRLKEILEYKS